MECNGNWMFRKQNRGRQINVNDKHIIVYFRLKVYTNKSVYISSTRTTKTAAFWWYPPPPPPPPPAAPWLKNLPKFKKNWNKLYTQHTFWSCLTTCANMKWIRRVFLKIQSGHDSVDRRPDGRTNGRTDGQGETSIPTFQLLWSGAYKKTSVGDQQGFPTY